MADKNEKTGNRRVPLLQWMASAAIVLLVFSIVGAHVHSRAPGSASQGPTDISSQARTPR